MKTKSLSTLSAISISTFIAAAVLPMASVNAWSEPLDCDVLTNEIERKLMAKGVANYELSVAAKEDAEHGKKIVGTCAGGTKKVLYAKTNAVSVAQETAEGARSAAREAAREALVISTSMHTRNAAVDEETTFDYAGQSTAELIDSLHVRRNMNLYYNYADMPGNVSALMQRPDNVMELIAALTRGDDDALVRFNLAMILNKKLSVGSLSEADRSAINAALAEQLDDESAWVRTEAVWGLRFAPDAKYKAAVEALVDDVDQYVSLEARATLQSIRYHEKTLAKKKEITIDPWTRTYEVWGLTFSSDFEYEISVRPDVAQANTGSQARATITEIRYKN
jgi:Protein of unknown function (DUF1161)